MKDSIIKTKSKAFAVRIVRLYKYLQDEKKEYVLSRQVLRSGTSIGANVHEAFFGLSRKDFAMKLQIALKEACETEYWIELLTETDYITRNDSESIMNDCQELARLLHASVKTAKNVIEE